MSVHGAGMTDMEYVAAGERYIGLAVERLTLSDINGGYRIKYEAVIDAYRNAALRFQAGRRWMSAASAYVKCAQFQEKVRGSHEAAASYFTDAAEMYKRCDPASAEECMTRAAALLCLTGRFRIAAVLSDEIAEMAETDGRFADALDHRKNAANYFTEFCDMHARARSARVAGELAARTQEYDEAAELFLKSARDLGRDPLTQLNQPTLLLNSGLCLLAAEFDGGGRDGAVARTRIENEIQEEFRDFVPQLCREALFLDDVLAALSPNRGVPGARPHPTATKRPSLDLFADSLFNFDFVESLSPWRLSILMRLKDALIDEIAEVEQRDLEAEEAAEAARLEEVEAARLAAIAALVEDSDDEAFF